MSAGNIFSIYIVEVEKRRFRKLFSIFWGKLLFLGALKPVLYHDAKCTKKPPVPFVHFNPLGKSAIDLFSPVRHAKKVAKVFFSPLENMWYGVTT